MLTVNSGLVHTKIQLNPFRSPAYGGVQAAHHHAYDALSATHGAMHRSILCIKTALAPQLTEFPAHV